MESLFGSRNGKSKTSPLEGTDSFRAQITAFKAADRKARPWALPSQAP